MLTVELRINGRLIGHAYVVNRAPEVYPGDECPYSWELYTVNRGTLNGTVDHRREDGAWELLRKVCAAANEGRE